MRTPARVAAVLFVLALLVRVLAALWLGLDDPPRGDERGYALLAASLAAGDGLRLPVPEEVATAAGVVDVPPLRAFRTPLVPLLLAPVSLAGGGLAAMRLLTALVGALGPPCLWLAARRPLGDRTALVAAAAYALWPPHVFVSASALSEPLAMVLLVAAAGLAPAAGAGAARRHAVVAGALSGLAVLARPAVLLPALLLVPAARGRRGLLLALGLAAVVAPWVVRNQLVLGRPLLATTSGVTLVGGSSPAAAAAHPAGKWLPPERVYADAADPPDLGMWGWSRLGEEASDRRFAADALGWLRAHPAGAARLAGWKLVRLFDPDPRSERPDAPLKALLGWLTLTPVLLLAAAGVPAALRRPAGWGPFAALLAGTVLTAAIFYGDTRMRAPADPALLLLAAAGAGSLVDALLARRAGDARPRPF